jgi:uncharacterized protein YbjT (DUF2867 family)
VDPKDIGAVAAEVLAGTGHAGQAYTLTGPEAITLAQAAATIGEVAGRQVNYVDVPEDAARPAMQGFADFARDHAQAWAE